MAINDIIIRRGPKAKQVVLGPDLLFGPTSDRRHRVGADVDRITGDVDFYEITSSFCGIPGAGDTPPGEYTWTFSPFQEKGFKRPLKAIRVVAVIKLTELLDGTQKTELLFRKTVPASDRKFVVGPFRSIAKERLFLSVERMGGVSSIQYQLSLDSKLDHAAPKPASASDEYEVCRDMNAVKKEEKPMQEVTDADKAWDMVKAD